jgi:hypothetical protein
MPKRRDEQNEPPDSVYVARDGTRVHFHDNDEDKPWESEKQKRINATGRLEKSRKAEQELVRSHFQGFRDPRTGRYLPRAAEIETVADPRKRRSSPSRYRDPKTGHFITATALKHALKGKSKLYD